MQKPYSVRVLATAKNTAACMLAVGVCSLGLMGASATLAAELGHARLVSGVGQELRIVIPVVGLNQADLQAFEVVVAPAADWQQAGLTPPVALESLTIKLQPDDLNSERMLLQISSSQAFDQRLADLLLDIKTASAQQRYQVSLINPNQLALDSIQKAQAAPALSSGAKSQAAVSNDSISVRPGDTMFAISRKHLPQGVSVYQLMMALFMHNQDAFISNNVNLVRAGAILQMPEQSQILAISDAEARRLFVAHNQEFARLRGMAKTQAGVAVELQDKAFDASAGTIAAADSQLADEATETKDVLRLSAAPLAGSATGGADASAGGADAASDAAGSTHVQNGATQANASQSHKEDMPVDTNAKPAPTNDKPGVADSLAAAISSTIGGNAARADTDQDVREDTKAAEARAIAEAKERVGQLEDNIKNLNEALKAQGIAAKDAVVQGAEAVGHSLEQLSEALHEAEETENSTKAEHTDADTDADASITSDAATGRSIAKTDKAHTDSPSGSSVAADTGKSGADQAHEPTTDSSKTAVEKPDHGRAGATQTASTITDKALVSKPRSWFKDNIVPVISGLLALIVLLVVWILRRASKKTAMANEQAQVTEAMVQQKIKDIDLDLK